MSQLVPKKLEVSPPYVFFSDFGSLDWLKGEKNQHLPETSIFHGEKPWFSQVFP
jgi:hypothetical protein